MKKQIIMRFISFTLVISMLLPMIQELTLSASAFSEEDAFYELMLEAIDDINAGSRAGSWSEAISNGVVPPWGYFHNAVQNHIVRKYGMRREYPTITYKEGQFLPPGKNVGDKGRADLSIYDGEHTYIWEVKPASYADVTLQIKGTNQLLGYVDSDPSYRVGDGRIDADWFVHGRYEISYTNEFNGLILYWFKPIDDDDKKKEKENIEFEVPIFVPNDEEEPEIPIIPKPEAAISPAQIVMITAVVVGVGTVAWIFSAHRNTIAEKIRLAFDSLCAALLIEDKVAIKAALNLLMFHIGLISAPISAYADDVLKAIEREDEEAFNEACNNLINAIIEHGEPDSDDEDEEESEEEDEEDACCPKCGAPRKKPLKGNPDWTRKIDRCSDPFHKPPGSPIILDLDGEGIETLPLSQGVFFDHKGNGFKVSTGWVGPNNGLLVRDINGNGIIDNGRELFGNHTLLQNGKQAANGFEALKELAEFGASVFDDTSPYWNEVMVWVDSNSNGITDPGELLTLEEAGVVSIDLDYYVANITDANGNIHREISTFTRDDETIGDAIDVWFVRNVIDSMAVSNLPVSEEVAGLPDLRGFGTAYSLHQAMMRDDSGQLQSLVEQFIAETSDTARYNIAKQILYKWTGAKTNTAVLEVFMGEKYTGGTGPNSTKNINDLFDILTEAVYNEFMAQTYFLYLYDAMTTICNGFYEEHTFDLTNVGYQFLYEISLNKETGERQFLDFIRNMYAMTIIPRVDLDSLREVLDQENTKYGYVLDSLNKPLIHNQSSNNLKGTNSGNLFWLDGKNNSIQIGNGDDTFLFFGDMGQNTITDGGGNNTIILFDFNQSDISVNQVFNSKGLNIEIVIEGTAGKITITDLTYMSNYNIVFSDGSMVDLINDFITIEIYTA
ncbi:MAG: hypothetical protein FWG70_11665 [Oscillospiraceae bacterium]|nr:hypothetical protein [Oscillospiraceae bacterium]